MIAIGSIVHHAKVDPSTHFRVFDIETKDGAGGALVSPVVSARMISPGQLGKRDWFPFDAEDWIETEKPTEHSIAMATLDRQIVKLEAQKLALSREADAAFDKGFLTGIDRSIGVADATEAEQDRDHGAANTGGANAVADALRALKAKAST